MPLSNLKTDSKKAVSMGYDLSAPKRTVGLDLNSDLVDRCRADVANFPAHVEALLAADLAQREAKSAAARAATEKPIDAFAVLCAEHGSLSEEMWSR
jgi:hypothetical protein